MRYMAYDAGLDFIDEVVSVNDVFLGSWATEESFYVSLQDRSRHCRLFSIVDKRSTKQAPVLNMLRKSQATCPVIPWLEQRPS